jgi:anionic cell wall polymer biosynthesis LytR-Cps2A-Psr (LCP) family protein
MNPNEDKWAIIHINPQTGETKAVNISHDHRMFVRDIAHDRLMLVLGGEEKVIIVQEDLSLINVDLGAEIF